MIARVEARSETAPEQRPVAVWVGGRRLDIVRTVDTALVAGRDAGEPHRQRLHVELEDGTVLRLHRTLPDGAWRVLKLPRCEPPPRAQVYLGGW
jgi:hypothetical protein